MRLCQGGARVLCSRFMLLCSRPRPPLRQRLDVCCDWAPLFEWYARCRSLGHRFSLVHCRGCCSWLALSGVEGRWWPSPRNAFEGKDTGGTSPRSRYATPPPPSLPSGPT